MRRRILFAGDMVGAFTTPAGQNGRFCRTGPFDVTVGRTGVVKNGVCLRFKSAVLTVWLLPGNIVAGR